jgi:heat-inducible transcriptional repressor
MSLDKRKTIILSEVVYRYIMTGVPVSSGVLSRTLNLGISPATIRNELSKLEEMGYLYHPHTSAGRIPTHQGYRFYVDSLMGRTRLRKEEREAIHTLFSHKTRELEQLLQETGDLLSRLTQALALVIAPRLSRSMLKHLDLLVMHDNYLLLVLITNTGRVEKKIVELKTPMNQQEIGKLQQLLNRSLQNRSLVEIREENVTGLKVPEKQKELATQIVGEIKEILRRDEYEGVYVGGKANLVRASHAEDIRRLEELMDALEKQYFILNMVSEVLEENQLLVKIGDENVTRELREFSLVATPYALGEEQIGSIGVIGPIRMNYARIIPMVDFFAKSLSKSLNMLRG